MFKGGHFKNILSALSVIGGLADYYSLKTTEILPVNRLTKEQAV